MKKALVLSLAVVLGLGIASFAQTLNGSWNTDITIDPDGPTYIAITSSLLVEYTVSGWTFGSLTTIDELGWDDQVFSVTGSLGAFSIGSTLDFDPSAITFESWEVVTGLSLAGVTFDLTFLLEGNDTFITLVGSGSAGSVDVNVTIELGDDDATCDFDFAGVDVGVSFPFCCAIVDANISFGCAGFEQVCFTVEDIALPGIAWLTLDAELCFDLEEGKTLTLTPGVDIGATACFNFHFAEVTGGTYPGGGLIEFGTFAITGIGIECEIGGVEFEGLSYWGATGKPAWLKGYWEAYRLSTSDDGCCGPFAFDITAYFATAGLLFDLARIDAHFDIQISSQFNFGMTLVTILSPAYSTLWTLEFEVTW